MQRVLDILKTDQVSAQLHHRTRLDDVVRGEVGGHRHAHVAGVDFGNGNGRRLNRRLDGRFNGRLNRGFRSRLEGVVRFNRRLNGRLDRRQSRRLGRRGLFRNRRRFRRRGLVHHRLGGAGEDHAQAADVRFIAIHVVGFQRVGDRLLAHLHGQVGEGKGPAVIAAQTRAVFAAVRTHHRQRHGIRTQTQRVAVVVPGNGDGEIRTDHGRFFVFLGFAGEFFLRFFSIVFARKLFLRFFTLRLALRLFLRLFAFRFALRLFLRFFAFGFVLRLFLRLFALGFTLRLFLRFFAFRLAREFFLRFFAFRFALRLFLRFFTFGFALRLFLRLFALGLAALARRGGFLHNRSFYRGRSLRFTLGFFSLRRICRRGIRSRFCCRLLVGLGRRLDMGLGALRHVLSEDRQPARDTERHDKHQRHILVPFVFHLKNLLLIGLYLSKINCMAQPLRAARGSFGEPSYIAL